MYFSIYMHHRFARLSSLFLCAAGLAFAGGNYWNVDEGGTTMKFLSLPVSPRSAGLAGSGIASPEGFSEITRNPLATTASDKSVAGVSEILFSDNIGAKLTSVYFGLPLGLFNTSAALEYLGYDDIEGRDEDGAVTSDYGAMAWDAQLGIGSKPSVFNWAVNFRFASQTIEDYSASALLADAGTSFKPGRYIAFGAVITNLGWVSKYASGKESAPLGLQAGVTGNIPLYERFDLALNADVYRRADYDPEWRFGSELRYKKVIALRAGYAFRGDTDGGVSGGIGLNFDTFEFGYAYDAHPAVGGYHHFNLGIRF